MKTRALIAILAVICIGAGLGRIKPHRKNHGSQQPASQMVIWISESGSAFNNGLSVDFPVTEALALTWTNIYITATQGCFATLGCFTNTTTPNSITYTNQPVTGFPLDFPFVFAKSIVSTEFDYSDFQLVTLGSTSNNMQTLVFYSNHVYGALFVDPSVVYRFDANDLTSYVTTNLFDGPIRDGFYSASKHRMYWLVQNSSFATIFETHPDTMATNTVLLADTDINDQIEMTSDDTYIWINGLHVVSTDGSMSQYRMSDWTRIGYLVLPNLGDQRKGIGNSGGLLFWFCKTNGHVAVVRAPTSNMTNYVFVESNLSPDDEKATLTFFGDYCYLTETYFDGNGSFFRFHTNTLVLEEFSTGLTNKITDLIHRNGYFWFAAMTNGPLGTLGYAVRADQNTLSMGFFPLTNNVHSMVTDGTNRLFISTRSSPATIYRLNFP